MDDNTGRVYFWDNFKGILIFLVVFGHALMPYFSSCPGTYALFSGIYLFHMPAFVFISGYFHSRVSNRKKSILRIFIAYILFNSLMMLYSGYILDMPFKLLEPYYSYWYLLAIIAWRLIDPSILGKRWLLPLSLLAAILIGFWNDVDNTLAMSRIIGFAPFYIAGFQVSNQASKFNLNDLMNRYLRKTESPINIAYTTLALMILVLITGFLLLKGLSFNDLIWFPYESSMGL